MTPQRQAFIQGYMAKEALKLTPVQARTALSGLAGAGAGFLGSRLYGGVTGKQSKLRDALSALGGGTTGATAYYLLQDKINQQQNARRARSKAQRELYRSQGYTPEALEVTRGPGGATSTSVRYTHSPPPPATTSGELLRGALEDKSSEEPEVLSTGANAREALEDTAMKQGAGLAARAVLPRALTLRMPGVALTEAAYGGYQGAMDPDAVSRKLEKQTQLGALGNVLSFRQQGQQIGATGATAGSLAKELASSPPEARAAAGEEIARHYTTPTYDWQTQLGEGAASARDQVMRNTYLPLAKRFPGIGKAFGDSGLGSFAEAPAIGVSDPSRRGGAGPK